MGNWGEAEWEYPGRESSIPRHRWAAEWSHDKGSGTKCSWKARSGEVRRAGYCEAGLGSSALPKAGACKDLSQPG